MIDASVLVDALRGPCPAREEIIGRALAAPHLIDLEVGQTFRRLVRRDVIDVETARDLLRVDAHIDIARYPHVRLLDRAWELRNNLSIYDASYIALAEALDVPLVTRDSGMAGVPGTRCPVRVVPPADD